MARQLRVRVTDEQRDFLEQLAKSRGRGENLSDVVRMIIADASRRPVSQLGDAIPISPEISALVSSIAMELDRKPSEVLNDCVRGIQAVADGDDRPPLISEELRLRRRYRAASRQSPRV